jgi:dTDP-6-deoxy-L-talose 4-dehydrogenase (NAD+)
MSRIVLLTGATGFVGRQVYKSLLNLGIKVRVVVRDGKAAEVEPSEYLESIVTTKDLFSESDIWWERACNSVDIVIHVAWYVEPGEYLDSPKNLDCLMGTLALAKGAAQAKVWRFIGIGTCLEYDLTDGHLSVDTPLKPLTSYAAAKAATFTALSQWLPAQDVEFVWCRLFYLYGEGEDPRRLVPYLRTMLESGRPAELTSGKQIRDFLDVREAGKMISQAVFSKAQGPVNICSGVPITVKALAEKVADEYGRRDLLQFGIRRDNLVDPPFIVGIK